MIGGMTMKRGYLLSLLALAAVVALSACSVRHGDFTVLSDKLVRTSDFDLSKADRVKGVVGRDVAHIIVIIPTKGQVTLKDALDDALRKGNGDVMTDAVITFWSWYIPYIYGETGWEVTGDVVRTRRD
jgi:hypothetical protein